MKNTIITIKEQLTQSEKDMLIKDFDKIIKAIILSDEKLGSYFDDEKEEICKDVKETIIDFLNIGKMIGMLEPEKKKILYGYLKYKFVEIVKEHGYSVEIMDCEV